MSCFQQGVMQRHDSEPLFGDDAYHLLRDDSLLHRTLSPNFSCLLEGLESLPDVSEQQGGDQGREQHQQQQGAYQQQDVVSQVAVVDTNMFRGGNFEQPFQQSALSTQQQEQLLKWEALGLENVELQLPNENVAVEFNADTARIESSTTAYVADTTPLHSVPSLQPWHGQHNFKISLPTGNRDRNKWCYSEGLEKLYLCPNVAVPVNVTLQEWVNANLTIMPVFKQSCHRTESVNRCFNCKNTQNCDASVVEHIVQVEGEGCEYSVVNERNVVTVPLRPPPPGEVASTLLIKIMCLTSCVGGPNRRPFCLVLTLRNPVTGEEIGRQILDIKCCKCPSRDLTNDEKARTTSGKPTVNERSRPKVRKLPMESSVGPKPKKPKIKEEPGTNSSMVKIAVPVQYEAQVKSYINQLIAADIVKKLHPDVLMYSEGETS